MKRILRIAVGRAGRAQEIERELRAHIALRTEELLGQGLSPQEARLRAEAAFGDYQQVAAACGRIRRGRERDRKRRGAMDAIRQDVRYALRVLGRAPGFALTAWLTLALGIGSSTAMFSVVHALLLRPLPFPADDRLVVVMEANPATQETDYGISLPLARDLRTRARSLENSGAYYRLAPQIRRGAETVRTQVTALEAGAWAALGVSPALGRLPAAAEHDLRNTNVVVLSDGYWRREFGADRSVLGRSITIDGQPHTVIGVMPPDFVFPSAASELWTPFARLLDRYDNRSVHILSFVGRMRPGVDRAQVNTELSAIMKQGAAGQSDELQHLISARPLRDQMVGSAREPVLILFGAIVALLVIACANLASLQLARGAARQDEIAVRAALGAGRWAVVRQLLVEAVLLGAAGLAAGIVVAQLLGAGLIALYPGELPFADQVRIDARVLWFGAAATLLAVFLFGLFPTWQSTRVRALGALRSGSRLTMDRRRHQLRATLVVSEIALAIVLVTGAALVGRSFARVQAQPPGFRTENLLLMLITPSRERVTQEQITAFYQQLPARLAGLPGVLSVSASSTLPISGGDSRGGLTIDGRPFTPGAAPGTSYRRVLPNYFRTIGIPLLAGREFDARDRGQEPFVTIVNETLARRYFGNPANALGRRIKVGPPENEPWLTIVGVVGDVRNEGLEANDEHATYEPHPQRPWRTMRLVAHIGATDGHKDNSSINALAALPNIRAALRELDSSILIEDVSTMSERISSSLAPRRFNATILGSFGLIGLFLAALGVHGVMAFLVTERRREFGIRASLGASAAHIRRSVLVRALKLVALGALIGVPATLIATRFVRSLLYDISPADAASLLSALGALLLVALLGAWWPARRASKLDPAVLLHDA